MLDVLEALNAAQSAALVQKVIDPEVVELQNRISPLVANIPREPWNSTTYYFNQRTQFNVGGFVTDGGVTGYAQAVTADYIGNLKAKEIEGTCEGFTWDIETALTWGCAAATAAGPYPQFDGLDSLVDDFSSQYANALDMAGAAFDLGTLDALIALIRRNGRGTNPLLPSKRYAFVCSTTLEDRMSQLIMNQQRYLSNVPNAGLSMATVAAGLNVASYRNIPLIPSAYLDATGVAMGACTTATATTTGSIAASTTYYYKVSAIIARFGETTACAEVSQATGGGTATNTITLSFTAPTGPDGYGPILYKVYRSSTTTTETLQGVVDATVGLGTDGITPILATSIVDTGAAFIPQNGSTVPGTLPTAYFQTNAHLKPPTTGSENIYLIPLDKNVLVRPYVREMQMIDLYPTTAAPDVQPFAVVGDTCLALRSGRWVARAANVVTTLAA